MTNAKTGRGLGLRSILLAIFASISCGGSTADRSDASTESGSSSGSDGGGNCPPTEPTSGTPCGTHPISCVYAKDDSGCDVDSCGCGTEGSATWICGGLVCTDAGSGDAARGSDGSVAACDAALCDPCGYPACTIPAGSTAACVTCLTNDCDLCNLDSQCCPALDDTCSNNRQSFQTCWATHCAAACGDAGP